MKHRWKLIEFSGRATTRKSQRQAIASPSHSTMRSPFSLHSRLIHRRRRPLQPPPPLPVPPAPGRRRPLQPPPPPRIPDRRRLPPCKLRHAPQDQLRPPLLPTATRPAGTGQGRRGLKSNSRLLVSSPAAPRTRMRAGRWPCSRGPGGGRPSRGAPRVHVVSRRHGRSVARPRLSPAGGAGEAWRKAWWSPARGPARRLRRPRPDLLLPAPATAPSCSCLPNLHLPVSFLFPSSFTSMYSFKIRFLSVTWNV
jgi:hypothetical protein